MQDVQHATTGTARGEPAGNQSGMASAPQTVVAPGMKAAALKGMPVVSIADSAQLGVVDDVLFDIRQMCVGVLRIVAGAQQVLVPFDQVRSLGSDAITVASNQLTEWAGVSREAGTLQSTSDLSKRKVVDEAGTAMGMVQGI
jgi:uncharacterized protein YrrD